ncbi:hypothetical protein RZN05_18665 [Sphingomonas sp. HF-S4]|uniref:Uncharacterized protein n=1 Tax=Sphingomonas agrestis TaxID=3080540 RepID=A0ABU3YCA4_9SPHN|nr:hypothetical protein [Sphingomonas sp. HF-S4]MDV3459028.1 hypothetical protein [Sphingomonas sp. HF-S4]
MIGNAIAAFIGHKIDASDGEGGTLGAVAGVAVWKIAKSVVPAALVLGAIAYGVHRFANSETAL